MPLGVVLFTGNKNNTPPPNPKVTVMAGEG